MDFTALTTMSSEDLASALTLDFATLDDAALTAALDERRNEATRLFGLADDDLTVGDANLAEALVASVNEIEGVQTERAAEVASAAERFAAARAKFAGEPADETDAEDGDESEEGDDAEDGDESDAEDGDESDAEGDGEGEGDGGEAAVTAAAAAAAARGRRLPAGSTRAKVAKRTKRPAKATAKNVVITASANVPGFDIGKEMDGLTAVASATQGVVKNFAPWNKHAAQALRSQGINEQFSKVPVAQFHVESTNDLKHRSSVSEEYDAVGEAVKAHIERVNASLGYKGEDAMAAAMAWCSPSEVVYNWIADFVVDGLLDLPEISAPRGGLMLTEGPRLLQGPLSGDVSDFGFGGTETEMEAGYVKTCETIECPDFFDHRLDFDGYCWKIPILTESSFPELIADAMRASDVAYAHKINQRLITDVLAGSIARAAGEVYGGTVMDTIEALVQIASKERRWWNIGVNAVMEVKLPDYALDIFKIEMQRRSGLALGDVATEQKVNAYFANHRLSVKYLSDFDERATSAHPQADWPANIRAIMYPAGTFVKAQKDVITISAVHDAASLSQNEYTGVFYEQGLKTIRRGYRSTVVTIPVCTAGATGANDFSCTGSL